MQPARIAIATLLALPACGGPTESPDAAPTGDAPAADARIDARPADAAVDAPPPDAAGNVVNDCTVALAVDRTASGADRTVHFDGSTYVFEYTPSCMRIAAGQSVTWQGDADYNTFVFHPLRAGYIVDVTKYPDPGSPIQATSSGTQATFAFPNTGEFPFYCDLHGPGFGMAGVIYVE